MIQKSVRVAIYARQSVSETGQAFSSLDAQRESVRAVIASQRSQGWVELPEEYSDGGFSGANLERPAFRRLLADVDAGRIDAVGVYRTDRLSRSLLDFAGLMQLFQTRGVAYFSVTESFDTSTPMGRMVLNILATFAQFERESIAQRTRDKLQASKRRGMWTGGRHVLGYDVVDKKLVVNPAEAEQVREIFALYLELDSMQAVADELGRRGWRTKSWIMRDGRREPGLVFAKSSVASLLANVVYVGKVHCGNGLAEGAHEAIIDQETWEAVRARTGENQRTRGVRTPVNATTLLQGLLWCACGRRMVQTFTKRGGKRWSYYVCSRHQTHGAKSCPGSRAASAKLEAFVVDKIRAIGRDPKLLAATVGADRQDRETKRPELQAEARRIGVERSKLTMERRNLVDALAQVRRGCWSASGSSTPRWHRPSSGHRGWRARSRGWSARPSTPWS